MFIIKRTILPPCLTHRFSFFRYKLFISIFIKWVWLLKTLNQHILYCKASKSAFKGLWSTINFNNCHVYTVIVIILKRLKRKRKRKNWRNYFPACKLKAGFCLVRPPSVCLSILYVNFEWGQIFFKLHAWYWVLGILFKMKNFIFL